MIPFSKNQFYKTTYFSPTHQFQTTKQRSKKSSRKRAGAALGLVLL